MTSSESRAQEGAREYREALACRIFGHRFGPWADIERESEHPLMKMESRVCYRGGCDGSDLRFKPWPKEPR